MTLAIKEEVLRFEIAVCDALAVEVLDTVKELFEAAFDFAWAHASVEIRQVLASYHQEEWKSGRGKER